MYKNSLSCANNDDQNNQNSLIGSCSQIEASAPGKFILSGEYSVVYGKHAIAVSIDLRTRVTIRPNKSGRVNIELRNIQQARSWPIEALEPLRVVHNPGQVLDYEEESLLRELMPVLDAKYIDTSHRCLNNNKTRLVKHDKGSTDATAAAELCANIDNNNSPNLHVGPNLSPTSAISSMNDASPHNYLDYSNEDPQTIDRCGRDATIAFLLLYVGISDSYSLSFRPSVDVIIESQLPVSCGLGSSSAFSVALSGALMAINRVEPELSTISNWALAIDKYFHGTPSGIDNNIITHGGSILFRQGHIIQHGNKQLVNLCAILVDSGVLRRTKDICNKVADKKREHPETINSIFNEIDLITQSAWQELNRPRLDMTKMDDLLKENQRLLECIDIGHPALTDIINISMEHGFCAKLTGAGGGGTAFILIDSSCQDSSRSLNKLKAALHAKNYRFYQTRICGLGLQVTHQKTTASSIVQSKINNESSYGVSCPESKSSLTNTNTPPTSAPATAASGKIDNCRHL